MADFLAVFVLAVSVLMIFAWYRVLNKMGFPNWYFILFLIPFVGPFMFLYLAFVEWPIERDMASLRFELRMRESRDHQVDDPNSQTMQEPPHPPSHTHQ